MSVSVVHCAVVSLCFSSFFFRFDFVRVLFERSIHFFFLFLKRLRARPLVCCVLFTCNRSELVFECVSSFLLFTAAAGAVVGGVVGAGASADVVHDLDVLLPLNFSVSVSLRSMQQHSFQNLPFASPAFLFLFHFLHFHSFGYITHRKHSNAI